MKELGLEEDLENNKHALNVGQLVMSLMAAIAMKKICLECMILFSCLDLICIKLNE